MRVSPGTKILWSFLVLAIVIYQVAALVEWRRQWLHFTSQALLLVAADERIHKLIQFFRPVPNRSPPIWTSKPRIVRR